MTEVTADASVLPWLAGELDQTLAGLAQFSGALLVCGPPGIGKQGFARAIAQAALCESPIGSTARIGRHACRRCNACGWFAAGNHPDFRLVEPAAATAPTDGSADDPSPELAPNTGRAKKAAASRSIRLAQVHQLQEFVSILGHRGARRVVIIDPAEALLHEAANALLKTLEEPALGVLLLLVSSAPQRLLPTVRSRLRPIVLAPAPRDTALRWLMAERELDEPDAARLLDAEGGSPLHAANTAQAGAAAVHRVLIDLLPQLAQTGLAGPIDAIADIEPVMLVRVVQRWLNDLVCVKAGAQPRYFPAEARRMQTLAARTSLAALTSSFEAMSRQRALAEHPLNARLFAESTIAGLHRAFS